MSNASFKPQQIIGKPKIKVVGVGGGGSNAVSRMYRDPIPEVEYISINTDSQALSRSATPIRLRVGDATARGLGVGGNAARGRQCHEENREEIKETLKGADLVFVAAGMGGGTGTGGAPVVAEVSRSLGALTIGVVTKPFAFEGQPRLTAAVKGIRALSDHVDTIIVIPNDRLAQVADEELEWNEAFRMADDVLRQGIQAIAELVLTPGDINLDFADVRSVMANAGQAWMAIGRGSGPNRAVKAAKNAIESPLLEVSVEGAKGVIFNVTGGPDVTLKEVHAASEFIQQIVSPDAHIFWGITTDQKMDEEVRLTVIATGFPLGDNAQEMISFGKQSVAELLEDQETLDIPPSMRGKLRRTPASDPPPQTDGDDEPAQNDGGEDADPNADKS